MITGSSRRCISRFSLFHPMLKLWFSVTVCDNLSSMWDFGGGKCLVARVGGYDTPTNWVYYIILSYVSSLDMKGDKSHAFQCPVWTDCISYNVTWLSTILHYIDPYYNYTNILTGHVWPLEPSELLTALKQYSQFT